ncbi:MAG TPA: cation diffusion facilitator family transporter [Gemmatales bacterium]|nr:cation diffusion facilitator family transporter [Gemmatales bacterium]
MSEASARSQPPRWPILLSILAAIVTMGLKFTAFYVSGSIGLLSDALESVINLVASVLALLALWYAARPPDAEHTYGHEKISYFSSGIEGMLILIAAATIAWEAVRHLFVPPPLEHLDIGLLFSGIASVINFSVALVLLREGRRHRSIILEADGHHLMTDVITSGAVIIALGLVWATGWLWLDPIIALLVAFHILATGLILMRRSFDGLMDRAWPIKDLELLRTKISDHLKPGMAFHALRTRTAGPRRLIEFHLLVNGEMSLKDAHDFAQQLEDTLKRDDRNLDVTIHLEPIEAEESWGDHELIEFEKPPVIAN